MKTLSAILSDSGHFARGVELVTTRGTMEEAKATLTRDFARELAGAESIDWVSITDNAGGNPQLAPLALGKPLLYAGKEVLIHLSCKDMNRNGLESTAWAMASEGFNNILALSGDYPASGYSGAAKPVFDIDSIGLTNLVHRLNCGMDPGNNPLGQPTSFVTGVGVNPGASDPDYEMNRFYWKVEAGAEYAITQPVFDAEQLLHFIEEIKKRNIWVPIIPGIWPLVSVRNAEFLANEVPGVVIPREVIARMRLANEKGKEFALHEGIAIAREMFEQVKPYVQGLQVSAPFGKVEYALQVFDGIPGIDATTA